MKHSSRQIIKVDGLSKKIKDIQAVSGLNMEVLEGDVYGFLGPNGSGKSTTIRMLLTLIKPDAGSIFIFGKPLAKERNYILSHIGALIEQPNVYEYFTAYKNLELLSLYSGNKADDHSIMEVLDLVGLKQRAHSKVKTYSKGMKQRLGIAQALLHDPKLLILDEPSSGLDPSGMKDIRDLILYLNKELKKTILLSSHQLNEIEEVANRMIIINNGKVVVEGDTNELLNAGDVLVRIYVDNPKTALKLLKESRFEISDIGAEKDVLTLNCKKEDTAHINKYLIDNGIFVQALHKTRTLEEYFLNLT